MSDEASPIAKGRPTRSTVKKDQAPRGVFRHPSGVWAARFTCGAGHVHEEKVGPLKNDAIRIHAARRQRAHDEPSWCPAAERRRTRVEAARAVTARPVRLREYAERWLREHVEIACKPRTREHYASVFKHHVYPTLGDVALGDVTRERLRTLLAERSAAGRTSKKKRQEGNGEHEPLSRSTLANILIPLRALLNAAVDDGKIASNPAVRLGRFSRGLNEREARKVEALTAEELACVLAVASKLYPESADILHVLAWTGLRLGEACALQWGDIDVAGRFLEVRRTIGLRARRLLVGAPKSGQARRVDLPAVLASRLGERRSIREAEAAVAEEQLSPWVFPSPSDSEKPLNAEHLRFKVWYRILRHANLRGVRLHDLRHTYASLLLQAGEPIGYVKQQLGHSSIQVTVDRYGHFVPGANRSAVDRLAETTHPALSNFDFSSTQDGNGRETKSRRAVTA